MLEKEVIAGVAGKAHFGEDDHSDTQGFRPVEHIDRRYGVCRGIR